jgi:glycosyltransferase involved in cell wall biosynthesis
MPKKILVITSEANSKVAGDSQSAINFAKALTKEGEICSIITCSDNINGKKHIRDINIYPMLYTGSVITKISARLILSLYLIIHGTKHKYWLVYGRTLGNRIAIIVGFLLCRKVIFRSTLASFDDLQTLTMKPYNKFIYSLANGYWALNNWFAKTYLDIYKAKKRNVFISPQGVNDRFRAVTNEQKLFLREKLKLTSELPIVVMVGHVTKRKGFPEIFDWLKSSRESFHLVIVGNYSPAEGSRLEKHFTEMHNNYTYGKRILGNYVTFTGEVNNVEEYLQAADIFLHASYLEGFPPNVLNEAMACGLPCIVREIVGIDKKYTEQKVISIYKDRHELNARMQDLLNNSSIREYYSENAKNFHIQELNIESIAKSFIQWLNSL